MHAWAATVFPALAGALLKGGVLLALGLAAMPLLRGAPAAWRHALLAAALTGSTALVAAAVAAPGVRWETRAIPFAAPALLLPAVPAPAPAAGTGPGPDASPALRSPAPRPSGPALPLIAVSIWLAGALCLLGRIGLGMRAVRRAVRDAEPAPDGVAGRAGLAVAAEIRLSRSGAGPFTCGTLRPVIVLPAGALRWPAGRLRAVLLHECAHVARRDAALAALGEVAVALAWMNPLAHLARSRALLERERAADDAVLRAGIRPSRYAADVLRLARDAEGWRSLQAVGLVPRRGSLGRRMRAVLAADVRRDALAPGRILALAALGGIGALPMAPLAPLAPASVGQGDTPTAGTPAARFTGCDDAGGHHMNRTRPRRPGGGLEWNVEWAGRGCAVSVRAVGAAAEPAGGRLVLTGPGDSVRVVIEDVAGARTFIVTGAGALPAWWPALLLELDRHTAYAVDERLPRLARGGAPAVLAEARQAQGDHAAAIYLTRAIGALPFTDAEVAEALRIARSGRWNRFTLTALLDTVAARGITPAVRPEYQLARRLLDR